MKVVVDEVERRGGNVVTMALGLAGEQTIGELACSVLSRDTSDGGRRRRAQAAAPLALVRSVGAHGDPVGRPGERNVDDPVVGDRRDDAPRRAAPLAARGDGPRPARG